MICLFARRRLGPYLDGALDAGRSRGIVRHLEACRDCRQEVDRLRRMALLIRQSFAITAEPDWTGLWPAIVRGIQDGAIRRPVVIQRRSHRRWILGGAAAAGVMVLTLIVGYEHLTPPAPEESAVVTEADTQYPGGTMVYHAPEKVAVVWVFDE